jgi:hypothetical protein
MGVELLLELRWFAAYDGSYRLDGDMVLVKVDVLAACH